MRGVALRGCGGSKVEEGKDEDFDAYLFKIEGRTLRDATTFLRAAVEQGPGYFFRADISTPTMYFPPNA
jgi:hypothetical protein